MARHHGRMGPLLCGAIAVDDHRPPTQTYILPILRFGASWSGMDTCSVGMDNAVLGLSMYAWLGWAPLALGFSPG
jgi:hypothetical protein